MKKILFVILIILLLISNKGSNADETNEDIALIRCHFIMMWDSMEGCLVGIFARNADGSEFTKIIHQHKLSLKSGSISVKDKLEQVPSVQLQYLIRMIQSSDQRYTFVSGKDWLRDQKGNDYTGDVTVFPLLAHLTYPDVIGFMVVVNTSNPSSIDRFRERIEQAAIKIQRFVVPQVIEFGMEYGITFSCASVAGELHDRRGKQILCNTDRKNKEVKQDMVAIFKDQEMDSTEKWFMVAWQVFEESPLLGLLLLIGAISIMIYTARNPFWLINMLRVVKKINSIKQKNEPK